MSIRITAPVADFSGTTGGIKFTRGTAVVETLPHAVATYMRRHRYLIRDDRDTEPAPVDVQPEPVDVPETKAAPGRRGTAKKEAGL